MIFILFFVITTFFSLKGYRNFIKRFGQADLVSFMDGPKAAAPAATTSGMTLSTNTVGQTSTKQEPQQNVAVRSMSSSTTKQWAESMEDFEKIHGSFLDGPFE